VLRGRWCNIVVLNVHAPSEEKSGDSKDSLYEELEQFLDHFSQYHMKILLGDFNAKVGRENISNRQLGMRYYIEILLLMVLEYKLCQIKILVVNGGARGSAAGWGTALQAVRLRVWFPMVSLYFFINIILSAPLWLWGRLSL